MIRSRKDTATALVLDRRGPLRRALGAAIARIRGPYVPWPHAAGRQKSKPAVLDCPLCHSGLTCPMEWGIADEASWWILVRCGDCEVWNEVVISNDQAAMLDWKLDRQMAAMRQAADRLDTERMAAETQAFIRALQADAIVAADFARSASTG
jgi:hypothetical protein